MSARALYSALSWTCSEARRNHKTMVGCRRERKKEKCPYSQTR